MSLELISFAVCPFAQRSIITLREKGVAFSLKLIDVEHPPAWFAAVTPLGRVPVLRVGGRVLFESSVINEYLDETYPPRLHPTDPLERAEHRAWIEFGSSLLLDQAALCLADGEAAYGEKRELLRARLRRLDAALPGAPFWGGEELGLIDAAYAPLFVRMALLEERRPELAGLLTDRLRAWGERLQGRASVRGSVVADFKERYRGFYRAKGSFLMAD